MNSEKSIKSSSDEKSNPTKSGNLSSCLKLPDSADRIRSPSNASCVTFNGSYPLLDEPIGDLKVNRKAIFGRRTSRSLDLDIPHIIIGSNFDKTNDTYLLGVPGSENTVSDSQCIEKTNSFKVPSKKNKNGRLSLKFRHSMRNRSNIQKLQQFGSLKKFASSLQFREPFSKIGFNQAGNPIRKHRDVQSDELSLSDQSTNEFIGGGVPGFRHPRASTSTYLKEQLFAFFEPSDNKLAMKLFGNRHALLKEKKRQQQQGHWIIHPCSSFRFYWDLLMLILLIANLIILPVAISFFNDDLNMNRIIFNCISDTIFLVDIGVNFRTGIITNDYVEQIILKPKLIARHYVKTWFLLDLLSSIPIDYIFLILNNRENLSQLMQAGRALRILRLAKLLSLLRLLRLSRLVRYVNQWEEFFNTASKFMGIFNLVLLMLLLGHWNACLQFLIPMLREYPYDSWIIKCDLKSAYWFEQYTWALFKAMSHMLSIGYGRFPPTSIVEAWVTIISMMTGATCYALFVGHAAALIQSYDTSKRLYREKFKQVEEYMAYRKLPRSLRSNITNYYEHRYQGKMFNETAILDELSECLREQIINYNCRALVATVPFFIFADHNFVSEVVVKLKFEVFQPGDIIIKEGTIGMKMYFIQEGIVDIITKDNEIATSLSDGSYFGEICLLANTRRVATVKAETYCNLYSLDRESFLDVLEHYPLMRRTMESIAAERLNKIGQDPYMISNRNDLEEDLKIVNEIVNETSSGAHSSDDCESLDENKVRKSSKPILNLSKIREKAREAGLLWKRKAAEKKIQIEAQNLKESV